jgi:hypothetical protein
MFYCFSHVMFAKNNSHGYEYLNTILTTLLIPVDILEFVFRVIFTTSIIFSNNGISMIEPDSDPCSVQGSKGKY